MEIRDDEWAIWAFGEEVWEGFVCLDLDTMDLLAAWNRRHPDWRVFHSSDPLGESLAQMQRFYEEFNEKECMDKKIHRVTKSMRVAEKDVKKGKPAEAVKVLKGAEKRNEKLVKMDKKRDKIIDNAKKGKC